MPRMDCVEICRDFKAQKSALAGNDYKSLQRSQETGINGISC